MKKLVLAIALFVPSLVWAQTPIQPSAQDQLSSTYAQIGISLAKQLDATHAQVADLKKQLEEAKKREAPSAK